MEHASDYAGDYTLRDAFLAKSRDRAAQRAAAAAIATTEEEAREPQAATQVDLRKLGSTLIET